MSDWRLSARESEIGASGAREYKTVPLTQDFKPRRRDRAADAAAAAMSDIINAQAKDGWRYVGADTVSGRERVGFFGSEDAAFTVLVFERPVEAARRVAAEEPQPQPQASRPAPRRRGDEMERGRGRPSWGEHDEETVEAPRRRSDPVRAVSAFAENERRARSQADDAPAPARRARFDDVDEDAAPSARPARPTRPTPARRRSSSWVESLESRRRDDD